MNKQQIYEHISSIIKSRLDNNNSRRSLALQDFFSLNMPELSPEVAIGLAKEIPELPLSLYEKWIDMFIERLFETASPEQLLDLCDGTTKNNATLALVYLLFMESERMEKQVAQDLKDFGIENSKVTSSDPQILAEQDLADALALYLKAQMHKKVQ